MPDINSFDQRRKWGSSARHRDSSSIKKFTNTPPTTPARGSSARSPPSSPFGDREKHSPPPSPVGRPALHTPSASPAGNHRVSSPHGTPTSTTPTMSNRLSAPHPPSESPASTHQRMSSSPSSRSPVASTGRSLLSAPSKDGRKLSARERLLGELSIPTSIDSPAALSTPPRQDLLEQQMQEQWKCAQCKYQNADPNGKMCALCGSRRTTEVKKTKSSSLIASDGSVASEASSEKGYTSESSGKSEGLSVKTIPTSNKDEQASVNTDSILGGGQDTLATEDASAIHWMESGALSTTSVISIQSDRTNTSTSDSYASVDASGPAEIEVWQDKVEPGVVPVSTTTTKPNNYRSTTNEEKKKKASSSSSANEPFLWCCSKRVAILSAIALLIATICFAVVAILVVPDSNDSGSDGTETMGGGGGTFTDPPIVSPATDPPTARPPTVVPPTPSSPTPSPPTETPPTPASTPTAGSTPAPTVVGPETTSPPSDSVQLVRLGESAIDPAGSNVGPTFGSAIAMSDDGKTIAVGAPRAKRQSIDDDDDSPGVIQVHRFLQGAWRQIGQDLFGVRKRDQMGFATAISPDGTTIAVGAPFFNDPLVEDNLDAGLVMIYKYDDEDNIWNVLGANGIVGKREIERVGTRLAISQDGTIVSVASHGYVQVFKYDESTDEWAEYGQPLDEGSRQRPSWETALSLDGKTVVVGTPREDLPGRAIVYDYQEDVEDWVPRGSNLASLFDLGDNDDASFTPIVSLSGDGNTVAVRLRTDADVEKTTIFIFSFDEEDTEDWVLQGEAIFEDEENFDLVLPMTLSLSRDGRALAANGFVAPKLFTLDKEWKNIIEEFADDEEVSVNSVSLSGDGGVLAVGDVDVGDVTVYEVK